MKRRNLCIAFLTLFALCVPLFLTSSDVSALKHQYVAIPYFLNNNIYGDSFYESIMFSGVNNTTETNVSFNKTVSPLVFASSGTTVCNYEGGMNTKIVNNNSVELSFVSYYKTYNGTNQYNEPYTKCMRAGLAFGDNPPLAMNWDSLPAYMFGNPNYRAFYPYYYEFSHVYLADKYIDTESGQHYTNQLNGQKLLGFPIHSFYEMRIPLEFVQTNIGAITQGRDVEFRGVFDFQDHTFQWGNIEDGSFQVRYVGQTESQLGTSDYTSGTIQCTANLRQVQSAGFTQLEYSCPWKSPVTFAENALGFTLDVNAGSGQYVWVTDGDLNWAGLYVITDKDETPGVNANSTPTGNFLQNAPGSAQGLAIADNTTVDWTETLENLFGFNLINPFAPIFNLFSDQNSCAQIPIIAGMIHSNETQVCPWFSTTTRNIVTPVLGLASMMLVFGFVVRWLGARSGNMFEDSFESDNYSFTNKYRRK